MNERRVSDLIALLGPAVLQVIGDLDVPIGAPAAISSAPEGSVSFCNREGGKAVELIGRTHAAVVLCGTEAAAAIAGTRHPTLVTVANPRLEFARVVRAWFAPSISRQIHPTAVIDPAAIIGEDVSIGAHSVVGAAAIGPGSTLMSGVHVYDGVTVGQNVLIHAGCVIGSDGFGFERNESGSPENFPHIGSVVIEDDVEFQADCHVSRGTMGPTLIKRGSKFDSGCHIAHNVTIGEDCLIAAHAMIAGSVTVGNRVWIGPSSAISDGLSIGDGANITIGAVVTQDVAAGQRVTGNLAIDHRRYMTFLKTIR
jgi:UDP-3-O-[3-hydroxymyristoyl] glucosamine N-acyltransferase